MRSQASPVFARGILGLVVLMSPAMALVVRAQPVDIDPEINDPQHFEVYVSEDALQAMYTRSASLLEGREALLQGGVFVTEFRDIVGMASAMSRVADPNRYPRWTFEVGARAYGALLDGEDEDVFGAGLGGQARYAFGDRRQLAAAFGLFYAPDILTFGDADSVYDTFGRIELELRDGLTAYAGYRLLEFDLADNRELDDHAHLGIRWSFSSSERSFSVASTGRDDERVDTAESP